MKPILNVLAMLSLALLIAPAFLFLAGRMSLSTVKMLMLAATVLWFGCTLPRFWQNRGERN